MTAHIVVIDDDPDTQDLYRLLLRGEGYRMTLFPPFTCAPHEMATLHADLILLDLLIGEWPDSWTLLQALKSDPRTANLPILLVTALSPGAITHEWAAFIHTHSLPLITKPFDIEALLALIHTLLSGSSVSPSNPAYNDPIS